MSLDPRPRVTRADLESHIAWRQHPSQRGGWTPARDLALAETLAQGRGVQLVADALGSTWPSCGPAGTSFSRPPCAA